MTLPQLWLADPSLWFIQVENKFRIHRIASEVRKHELLDEALPPQAMAEIRDILVGPPANTSYTTVEQDFLHRLVPPKHRRIQQLLCNEELGNHRPTQFLCHLQHLLGDQPDSSETCILRPFHVVRHLLYVETRTKTQDPGDAETTGSGKVFDSQCRLLQSLVFAGQGPPCGPHSDVVRVLV
ncbi:uncharacterized protein LOC142803097 [Rhipicephalus microplus]|uniref:uncharacterized protein LOC142803097 n=1 Tax=Rhipicephalus microplus TaxID=6941 RepID=UPI003F6D560F